MDLSSQAISAALSNDWKKAVEVNSQLLKTNCQSVDCLNRLGKAYLELGENKKAATIFRKVLKIDRYDPIAQRNLARTAGPIINKKTVEGNLSPEYRRNPALDFLEEPGKTKLISLVNLAAQRLLLKQKQADQLQLTLKRHTVVVMDLENNYLGSLPDDVGHRLSVLVKGGNKYCALVKSVSKNSLVVFVRETVRAKKFADTSSFIPNANDYFSFVRDELLTEAPPVVTETDTDDEATASAAEKLHADEEDEAGQ